MEDTTINNAQTAVKQNKLIIYFLLAWTALNALQAYTLGIHADEAYYWLYSRFLDWGYYDHPPMVAIYIKAGYSLLHSEFGLRLCTVISSTASVYIIWLILKRYQVNALNFILVISGIFVFHIYGFTTTPDSPLLLFTTLFLCFYQQYAEKDSWPLALILGIVVACLLYSKYHGLLLVSFTLISNVKLLKRLSFWGILVLAVALYIPHILWQINHDYPSINYHLYERSAKPYDLSYTYQYPLGQLLMAGPFIGWFLFYKAFSVKIKDAFIRALMFTSIGILMFFFVTSFRGEVQLHWTLIAYVPLSMLVLINFEQSGKPAWFNKLAVANIVLIVAVRLCIICGFPFIKKIDAIRSFFDFNEWAHIVHDKVGDNYVIFSEGFQNPSKYNFYNNSLKGFAYDTRYYRRTQYDIWPIEDSLQHKRVYYLLGSAMAGITTDTIKTPAGDWYGAWINNVRTYQKIDFETTDYNIKASPGEQKTFDLSFQNPYPFPINFRNDPGEHSVTLEACFFVQKDQISLQTGGDDFYKISLKPGETGHFKFTVKAPEKPGKYDLFFSIRTEPFPGGKNNKLITFTVE